MAFTVGLFEITPVFRHRTGQNLPVPITGARVDNVLFIVKRSAAQDQRVRHVIDQRKWLASGWTLAQRFAGHQRLYAVTFRHFRRRAYHRPI